MRKTENFLLDTHIWIWLVTGNKHLAGTSVLEDIRRASLSSALYLSAISIWEVAMLEKKGRIILADNINDWVEKALSIPRINIVPLTPAVSIQSANLPEPFHKDPADRIIVSAARHFDLTLITADRGIISFGKSGHVRIHPKL